MKEDLKQSIGSVINNILDIANKERKESKPYKDLFTDFDEKNLPIYSMNICEAMDEHVLSASLILNESGYKVSNELYEFMLALPILHHVLRKDIKEKDGWICCEDKVRHILGNEFRRLVESNPLPKLTS